MVTSLLKVLWGRCGVSVWSAFYGSEFSCHRQASLTEQANARAAAGSSGGAAGNGILATMFGRSAAPAESPVAPTESDVDEPPKVALQSDTFCIPSDDASSHIHLLSLHPRVDWGSVDIRVFAETRTANPY